MDRSQKNIVSLAPSDQWGHPLAHVYLEKVFDGTDFRPQKRLPMAKELGETSLVFLVHPTLTEAEINKTCDVITDVMSRASIT